MKNKYRVYPADLTAASLSASTLQAQQKRMLADGPPTHVHVSVSIRSFDDEAKMLKSAVGPHLPAFTCYIDRCLRSHSVGASCEAFLARRALASGVYFG